MPSVNRTTKIQSLNSALKKRHPRLPKAAERSVFLHLIYAACLENATTEAADRAMEILEEEFVDWNEVRVSTPSEIADTIPHLTEPLAAGERIKRALQAVFDSYYDFTLDDLLKKPAAQANQFFESFPSITPFMAAYVTQLALGGHVIPLDEASLRIFRLLDLTQVTPDKTREIVPTLERAITKGDGIAFATMLHHLAAQFYDDPESASLKQFLKPIDASAKDRSWTPPTLAPSKREPIRPVRHEITSDPAQILVAQFADEDTADEVRSVGEIEFIPYSGIGEGEDSAAKSTKSVPKKPQPAAKTASAKSSPKKPQPTAKTAPAKPTPKKPQPAAKSAPAKPAPKKPQPAAKPAPAKPASKKPQPAAKPAPAKSAPKKTQPPKKATPTKKVTDQKSFIPKDGKKANSSKSPITKLRHKKPR
ncbi:MAG: hypothetical protein ACRC46_12450 [Thermoguttaceae bacterium]